MASTEGADGEAPGGGNPLSGYVGGALRLSQLCHLMNIPGTIIYNRKKDQESATGQWFSELVQPNPWYKDVVPDVCGARRYTLFATHADSQPNSSKPFPIASWPLALTMPRSSHPSALILPSTYHGLSASA